MFKLTNVSTSGTALDGTASGKRQTFGSGREGAAWVKVQTFGAVTSVVGAVDEIIVVPNRLRRS